MRLAPRNVYGLLFSGTVTRDYGHGFNEERMGTSVLDCVERIMAVYFFFFLLRTRARQVSEIEPDSTHEAWFAFSSVVRPAAKTQPRASKRAGHLGKQISCLRGSTMGSFPVRCSLYEYLCVWGNTDRND